MRLRILLYLAPLGLLAGCENPTEPDASPADEHRSEEVLAEDPLLQEVIKRIIAGTEDELIYLDVLHLMTSSEPKISR